VIKIETLKEDIKYVLYMWKVLFKFMFIIILPFITIISWFISGNPFYNGIFKLFLIIASGCYIFVVVFLFIITIFSKQLEKIDEWLRK